MPRSPDIGMLVGNSNADSFPPLGSLRSGNDLPAPDLSAKGAGLLLKERVAECKDMQRR